MTIFVPPRVEFLNIVISKSKTEQIGVIKNGIMSVSYSGVLVHHEDNVSSSKESVLYLSFLPLQMDLLVGVGIFDDLFVQG